LNQMVGHDHVYNVFRSALGHMAERAIGRGGMRSLGDQHIDSRGVALPDTVVSVSRDSAAEPIAIAMMISIEGGQFTLQGISPGAYELRFERARFKTRAIKITVGPSVQAIDAGTVTLERGNPH